MCDEVVILKDGAIVHQSNLEDERRSNKRFVELEVTGDDSGTGAALREIGADGVTEGGGRWRIVLPAEVEVGDLWSWPRGRTSLVRKLTHRRDTLEEIFLKAMGHLAHTPGEGAADAPDKVAVPMAVYKRGYRRYQGPLTGHLDAVAGAAPLRLANGSMQQRLVVILMVVVHVLAAALRRLHLPRQSRGSAAGARQRRRSSDSSSRSTAEFFSVFMNVQAVFAVILAALAGPA